MLRFCSIIAAAAAGLVLATPPAAAKASCPAGQKLECLGTLDPKRPPRCRCVDIPSSGQGSHGKAEVKKKNVPAVKPNKTPGPND